MPNLNFKGKQHIYAHHLTIPHRQLIPVPEKSFPTSSEEANHDPKLSPHDNLIIHGDNLHALKALLPRYGQRIKCIYIDPPFNTGSQSWVFNDNVNGPLMQEWFSRHSPVDGEDMERHDKWLCMMWARLQLMKELLAEDGLLLVSIDDHEVHHLRVLLDEIFGSDCFVTCLAAVVNLKGSRDNRGFANTHEYILVYEKKPRAAHLRDLPVQDLNYANWEQDEKGWFKKGANLKYSGENAPREKRPNLYYPIYVSPDGTVSVEPDSQSVELWPIADGNREVSWRWGKDRVRENASEVLAIGSGAKWSLFKKQRPQFGLEPSAKPKTTFFAPIYSATTATITVKTIFDNQRVFDYPKSPFLIADLLRIADVRTGDFVLDSFAGSGTTAQAVLELNKEDGGNRKFILVECEEYADEITAERVRRVISGVPTSSDHRLREGTGGSFSFCTLGEPIDIENLLRSENLPDFSVLASFLLYTATGCSTGQQDLKPINDDGFFFSLRDMDYYLIYEPSTDFLLSNRAVLNMEMALRINASSIKATVFAAAKYISQRELTKLGITFCQLPYEIHRFS